MMGFAYGYLMEILLGFFERPPPPL